MISPNTLYKLRQPSDKGFDFLSSAEFMSAIFVEEPVARPDDPQALCGEWYCRNDDCDVREVRVNVKFLDGPAPKGPPRMKCPSCGEELWFHHCLRKSTLLLVGAAPDPADVRRAVAAVEGFRRYHAEELAVVERGSPEEIDAARRCGFLEYHRESVAECDLLLRLLASLGERPAAGDKGGVAQAEHGRGGSAGDYRVIDGRITHVRQTKRGPVARPLCNFDARIVEEGVRSDGARSVKLLAIEGVRDDGTIFPRVEVSASAFGRMDWVLGRWGPTAIVEAGCWSRLARAIRQLSTPAALTDKRLSP